jgi:hypothetical protein
MRELVTEVQIAAPPDAVWAVLTDFAAFPSWNPFVRALDGELRVGAKLRVLLQPPGGRAMTFRPRLRAVEPARELRWLGRLVIPGLFDGEHAFVLEPHAAGTRFIQRERFTGLLVPLLEKMIDGPTRAGFEAMNAALKQRAEATSSR